MDVALWCRNYDEDFCIGSSCVPMSELAPSQEEAAMFGLALMDPLNHIKSAVSTGLLEVVMYAFPS